MHVVYIVVDGLRQDTLSRLYTEGKLTGGLKFLLEHGLVCENAYATGCPTQFSAPSIFTSTLPLDYGGYDYGIRDRPVSLTEILANAGYHCFGTASGPWESRVFGYSRGFETFYHCYDINAFTHPLLNQIYREYYQNLVQKNIITRKEGEGLRKQFLLTCLPFIREEIAARLEKTYPDWIYPKQYAQSVLQSYLETIERFTDQIRKNEISALDAVVPLVVSEKTASLVERTVMTVVNALFPGIIKTNEEFFPTVYATKLFSQYYDYFRKHASMGPQFQYMHLLDTHELRFSDHLFQVTVPPIGMKKEDAGVWWYERAILHIDARLDTYLKKMITAAGTDNVAVVLSGDHGHHYGYPNRVSLHQQESPLADIYHESLDSALIVYAPTVPPRRYTEPCSLLDIAPTILDLVHLPAERTFQGHSLLNPRKTSVRISESAGRGPCHLPTKPVYLSITMPPYKMIYREFFHPGERIRKKMELYHLQDRYEQEDLVDRPDLHNQRKTLQMKAEERIQQIRSYHKV